MLVNWYDVSEKLGKNDYIGPHSDDDTFLDKSVPIYSITYGAPRIFKLESRKIRKARAALARRKKELKEFNRRYGRRANQAEQETHDLSDID
jgi:alkylated DNA repair dioxygenase AlkB